jgi:hypothetical protein
VVVEKQKDKEKSSFLKKRSKRLLLCSQLTIKSYERHLAEETHRRVGCCAAHHLYQAPAINFISKKTSLKPAITARWSASCPE